MTTTQTAATVTATRYGWAEYDRYIGTCKACKRTFSVTVNRPIFHTVHRPCPDCGTGTKVEQVYGSESPAKKCDARCLNAKRASCECSCGGKNHGGGH